MCYKKGSRSGYVGELMQNNSHNETLTLEHKTESAILTYLVANKPGLIRSTEYVIPVKR